MNIFRIAQELSNIINEIELNEGEITPEIEEKLQVTEHDFYNKIESYTNVIKQLDWDTKSIDDEIKRLQSLKKTKQNTIKNLKNVLIYAINNFGNTTKSGSKYIDYNTGKISIRKTQSVVENETVVDTIGKCFETTVLALKNQNQLFIDDKLNIDELIEDVNETLKNNPETSYIQITKDDFDNVVGEITFNLNLTKLSNDEYSWFRNMVNNTLTYKLTPKIDKTIMKGVLQENTSNIASLSYNESLIIK